MEHEARAVEDRHVDAFGVHVREARLRIAHAGRVGLRPRLDLHCRPAAFAFVERVGVAVAIEESVAPPVLIRHHDGRAIPKLERQAWCPVHLLLGNVIVGVNSTQALHWWSPSLGGPCTWRHDSERRWERLGYATSAAGVGKQTVP
jgi:hypothetical protein